MTSQAAALERVGYYESLEPKWPELPADQRARLRLEMREFYDSLSPFGKVAKFAAGGAAIGAVLPRVSWITGGLIGAAIGLAKQFSGNDARERLAALLQRLGLVG